MVSVAWEGLNLFFLLHISVVAYKGILSVLYIIINDNHWHQKNVIMQALHAYNLTAWMCLFSIKLPILVKICPTIIEILTFNKWSSKGYHFQKCAFLLTVHGVNWRQHRCNCHVGKTKTRHRASTSMYSLTFCICSPGRRSNVQNAPRRRPISGEQATPTSHIRRAILRTPSISGQQHAQTPPSRPFALCCHMRQHSTLVRKLKLSHGCDKE